MNVYEKKQCMNFHLFFLLNKLIDLICLLSLLLKTEIKYTVNLCAKNA